ncbi:msha biogenesis protein mshn [Vibrio parahaemolyticus AQ3810]|nr:msha biogenesis protein mshn [Vibrio parahaemolyticus AQ3810]
MLTVCISPTNKMTPETSNVVYSKPVENRKLLQHYQRLT